MWKLILLILAGLYTLNPYDILPDFMVGWGWLDDLIIWILVWKFLASQSKKFAHDQRFDQHTDSRFRHRGQDQFSDRSRSNSHDQNTETGPSWDPHRILGISRNASADEIKHAYRELANKYHPDKLEHLGDEFKILAEKRFKEIQQAYQELTGKGG
ncbi:MAG: DnaJ domain-containing protein [Desulfobacterales bacterium]|jgi:DnaJ like chaperone protein